MPRKVCICSNSQGCQNNKRARVVGWFSKNTFTDNRYGFFIAQLTFVRVDNEMISIFLFCMSVTCVIFIKYLAKHSHMIQRKTLLCVSMILQILIGIRTKSYT